MVRDSITTKLTNLPIRHSDRHLVFRCWVHGQGLHNYQAYKPTNPPLWPPLSVQGHSTLCMLQLSWQILLKKTNFTQTYAAFFETFQQMTRLSSLAISKPEHAETQKLGKHSVGNCNDNGLILRELCTEQLCITNVSVQQIYILKTTWHMAYDRLYPRAPTWPERCSWYQNDT